jgi:hypothetical protein
MVREIVRRWLGIDDILEEFKRVPSTVMLQVAEANQKKRHEELLGLMREKSLTPELVKPKIVPKAMNWKRFRSAAEKALDPEEQEA